MTATGSRPRAQAPVLLIHVCRVKFDVLRFQFHSDTPVKQGSPARPAYSAEKALLKSTFLGSEIPARISDAVDSPFSFPEPGFQCNSRSRLPVAVIYDFDLVLNFPTRASSFSSCTQPLLSRSRSYLLFRIHYRCFLLLRNGLVALPLHIAREVSKLVFILCIDLSTSSHCTNAVPLSRHSEKLSSCDVAGSQDYIPHQ